MDRAGFGLKITYINLDINFSHLKNSPICPMLDNMSHVGQYVQYWINKAISQQADY